MGRDGRLARGEGGRAMSIKLNKAARDVLNAWDHYGTAECLRGWIDIMRAALETPQGEPVKGAVWYDGGVSLLGGENEDAFCAVRGAQRLYLHPPAAPQGEPVAYIHRQGNYWETSERHLTDDEKARGWTEEPLYTAPPQRAEPVQEPVAWADRIAFESAMNNGKGCDVWPNAGDYVARTGRAVIRLYTAPPATAGEQR